MSNAKAENWPGNWVETRPEGLYVRPGGFYVDPMRPVDRAVITHGHADHARPGHGAVLATPETLAITERGIRNFLIHFGLMRGELELPAEPQIYLDMPDASCYVQSEHSGLLELTLMLGDVVQKGEVIARIYDLTRSGTPPVEYRAGRSGVLAARRFPAQVNMGDTIAVIAEVVESLG